MKTFFKNDEFEYFVVDNDVYVLNDNFAQKMQTYMHCVYNDDDTFDACLRMISNENVPQTNMQNDTIARFTFASFEQFDVDVAKNKLSSQCDDAIDLSNCEIDYQID